VFHIVLLLLLDLRLLQTQYVYFHCGKLEAVSIYVSLHPQESHITPPPLLLPLLLLPLLLLPLLLLPLLLLPLLLLPLLLLLLLQM
jgi:hypothetical protein